MKIVKNTLISADDSDIINGHFEVPEHVTHIGNDFLYCNETLKSIDLKNVTHIGNCFLYCNETLKSIDLKNVTHIGNCFLYYNKTLKSIDLTNVTHIGNYFLYYNETLTIIDLKNVTHIGNCFLCNNETLKSIDLKNVTHIGNDFLYYNRTLKSIDLKNVTHIGNDFLYYNRTLKSIDLKNVTHIGNCFLYCNETLKSIDLKNVTHIGNCFLYCNKTLTSIDLKNAKLNVRKIDNTTFIVESSRKLKDVEILKGYVLDSIIDSVETKRYCYAASNGTLHAHGETSKQAVKDLQFKIAQEKLKNEPITLDTVIDVNHYRALTGACETGIAMWKKQHNVVRNEITVAELLPILEQTNAYGLEKFKAMIKTR